MKKNKEDFFGYFNSGMCVAESYRYHKGLLDLEEENKEQKFASGRTKPTHRSAGQWYDVWGQQNLGPRSGLGVLDKIKEKLKLYEEVGAIVMAQEAPFAIPVITPLMERANELITKNQLVFVDTTSARDAANHSITFLLTPCAARAVPVDIVITQGKTEVSYTAEFQLLKKDVNDAYRGLKAPKYFITDNSQAEINAIKAVWPESSNCGVYFMCVNQ